MSPQLKSEEEGPPSQNLQLLGTCLGSCHPLRNGWSGCRASSEPGPAEEASDGWMSVRQLLGSRRQREHCGRAMQLVLGLWAPRVRGRSRAFHFLLPTIPPLTPFHLASCQICLLKSHIWELDKWCMMVWWRYLAHCKAWVKTCFYLLTPVILCFAGGPCWCFGYSWMSIKLEPVSSNPWKIPSLRR